MTSSIDTSRLRRLHGVKRALIPEVVSCSHCSLKWRLFNCPNWIAQVIFHDWHRKLLWMSGSRTNRPNYTVLLHEHVCFLYPVRYSSLQDTVVCSWKAAEMLWVSFKLKRKVKSVCAFIADSSHGRPYFDKCHHLPADLKETFFNKTYTFPLGILLLVSSSICSNQVFQ